MKNENRQTHADSIPWNKFNGEYLDQKTLKFEKYENPENYIRILKHRI